MLSIDLDIERRLQAASERIFPHHPQPRVVDLANLTGLSVPAIENLH